jgi:uncharacterized membrane protein
LRQRLIDRAKVRSPRLRRAHNPIAGWTVGHMIRLANAESVCLSALALYVIGGPGWLVDVLFVVGMLLLLTWHPGAVPAETEPTAS